MSVRDRFSLIGHAAMPLMNALTEGELVSLLDAAELGRGARVLDLGGGRGDLSRLVATRYGASALCVDRSPAACEEARARTVGLEVEVVCDDAHAFLGRARPEGLALACAVGALHAFGSRLPSWSAAVDALAGVAGRVLVADLVAHTPRAADEFDLAPLDALAPLREGARGEILLGPERVIAYERAWCAAILAHAAAHPADPRSAWARGRVEWSESPKRAPLWSELGFLALLT